jgi:hypothetical protein
MNKQDEFWASISEDEVELANKIVDSLQAVFPGLDNDEAFKGAAAAVHYCQSTEKERS